VTKADDLGDAIGCSMEYQLRCFVAGFLAIPFIMSLTRTDVLGAAAFAMFYSIVVAILTFPGSVIINLVALRLAGSERRIDGRARGWTAAVVAVLLSWTGYAVGVSNRIEPPELLVRTVGEGAAMVLFVTGPPLLSSTLGLVVGWAWPSRKRAAGA
jgi:hypothetical protein